MKNLALTIMACFLLFSCEKDTNEQSSNNEVESFFTKLFTENVESDFDVFTSFVAGDPLSESPDSALQVSCVIQANTMDLTEQGSLKANAQNIPFFQNVGAYSLSVNHRDDADQYVGGINNYEFTPNSSSMVPSFSSDHYSPAATKLEFVGLVNDKLPPSSDLVVKWTPDNSIPAGRGKAAIMVSARDDLGENHIYDYLMLNDDDGEVTLTTNFLNQFSGYTYFTVEYYRGYNQPQMIEGKVIDFQFVGYTYTSILWGE